MAAFDPCRVSPTIFAGTPATIAKSGTSFVTTAPAPTNADCSDRQAWQNGGVRADRGAALHLGEFELPVFLSHGRAVGIGRPRQSIVGKHHAVANKDFVFNNDSLANKAVGGDFATRADRSVFLDFHEGTDAAVISNRATVKVHLIRMINLDVGSQFTRI